LYAFIDVPIRAIRPVYLIDHDLLLLLFLLLLTFVLGPLASFPPELICNYGSYKQLVGLLGRVIGPVTRPLPTQDNTNTEETRTDIHASSRIRTHDPSV
jgi:hypothetical protein